MIVKILLFLIIFGTVVISHEFGHFLIGKRNGIRVLEFSVGMGPTLFSFNKGETKYSLKLLPLGGACIFDGEDGVTAKEEGMDEHSFPSANVWARIATVFAGPFFNFILAFVFSLIIVAFEGSDRPVVNLVAEGSAAQEAGIMAGDEIVRINGERIRIYRELTLIASLNKGEPLEIQLRRDGEMQTVVVNPIYNGGSGSFGTYTVGVGSVGRYTKCGPVDVFKYAVYEVRYWVKATYKSLLILLHGQASKEDVSGPIGIADFVGKTYDEAKPYGISITIFTMMNIVILLSVNLGIINLLPLPALDGGRLIFMFIEVVRGKPIPPEKEGMVHFAGLVALMLLMVFVMYNDVMKLFA